ncbi:MaoC family dehydratase N-terminal domain-containing protein [Pseudonocardia sp. NPDC049154]|uniref:FAS1-like dehydratase domain-containing protein n=1 Tax=Pseudonocardia sp. NPDC049154 TaxID=3155501 RepID=UPI0033C003BB
MSGFRFPVEAGHVMLFARAVGDDNPVYRDPETAAASEVGGLIAPPTFTAAAMQFDPDAPLRPRPGEKWFGSASGPGTMPEGGGGLHAEQHYTYHRTVRVGDVLTSTSHPGETWEKRGRSGRLVFTENVTEFRDEAGELVVTARSVGVKQLPLEEEGS